MGSLLAMPGSWAQTRAGLRAGAAAHGMGSGRDHGLQSPRTWSCSSLQLWHVAFPDPLMGLGTWGLPSPHAHTREVLLAWVKLPRFYQHLPPRGQRWARVPRGTHRWCSRPRGAAPSHHQLPWVLGSNPPVLGAGIPSLPQLFPSIPTTFPTSFKFLKQFLFSLFFLSFSFFFFF